MRTLSFALVVACLMLTVGVACALDEGEEQYKKMPGYVDFGELGSFDESEEAVEVWVEAPLLRLVARAADKEEPGLAQVLAGVHLIKVNTFRIDSEQFKELTARAAEIEKVMVKKGWEPIVRAKEKGERAYVYMKYDEKEIAGIAVIALEENGEAAFVNIVGNLDLEALSQLSGSFDIPELDLIEKAEKEKAKAKAKAEETEDEDE